MAELVLLRGFRAGADLPAMLRRQTKTAAGQSPRRGQGLAGLYVLFDRLVSSAGRARSAGDHYGSGGPAYATFAGRGDNRAITRLLGRVVAGVKSSARQWQRP